MCDFKDFYLCFHTVLSYEFLFFCILTFPSLSLTFLRDVFLVFSFTLYILLLFMHIYTFMQVIRIIHRLFPTILSIISLMKSEGNRFASKCIISDFPPNLRTSIPCLSSAVPETCVGQLFCFHSIPNTPPVLLLGICHNMNIISYPLPPQSPMSSAPLSCCHFHCTLPLSPLTSALHFKLPLSFTGK